MSYKVKKGKKDGFLEIAYLKWLLNEECSFNMKGILQ